MARKLTLVNQTKWNTRDLRKFVLTGLRAEVGMWQHYHVTIRTQRTNLGNGYVGWRKLSIAVQRPESRAIDHEGETQYWNMQTGDKRNQEGSCTHITMFDSWLRRMAITLAHEVHHNNGVSGHRDMNDSERDVSWVNTLIESGFKINVTHPVRKPKRNLQEERHIHAAKMLAKHEKLAKKEKKLATKWRQKVKYYQKAQVKKAARAAGENTNA